MMPLINEKVSSIKSQYHRMKIIRDTIGFLNPNQIPVDVSGDQPVFAFSKEVHLRYPSNFGPGLYLCMLGNLHIEHFYWKLIIDFQINILLFVRSIRQGNFT